MTTQLTISLASVLLAAGLPFTMRADPVQGIFPAPGSEAASSASMPRPAESDPAAFKEIEARLNTIETRLGSPTRAASGFYNFERRISDIEKRLDRIEQQLKAIQQMEQRVRKLETAK